MENGETAQKRAVLLAAARARMGGGSDFTVHALLTDTGISRAEFRICFAGKKQLLEALTSDNARALGQILEAAEPVMAAAEIRQAVGSDLAPPSSSGDAWLERRLRVFERALAALEKRQERTEQEFLRQIALMTEKVEAHAKPAAPYPVMAPEVFDPSDSNLLPADSAPQADELAHAPEPASSEPGSPVLARIAQIAEHHGQAAPAGEMAGDAGNETQPETVGEKEIANFLAHARQLARAAMPPPAKPRRRPLREAVVLAGILVGGLVVIGATLLLASASPRAMPATAHREAALDAHARVMALADNGNPDAQTMVALAYLRGNDRQGARRWSMAAAAQGQPVAEYLLGTLYLEDHQGADAKRWLAAAAAQGSLKAMQNLGVLYAQGTPEEAALAPRWFANAAAQGYPDSAFDLAVLYERGLGVPQDAAAALKWYLVAAGEGDAPSQARAGALRRQMNPAAAQAAAQDASAFSPKPANPYANAPPDL